MTPDDPVDLPPSEHPDPSAFEWEDILAQFDHDAELQAETAAPAWEPPAQEPPPLVMVEPEPAPEPQEPPAWDAPDSRVRRRVSDRRADPMFMYAVLLALSVGLTPLAAGSPNERYAILWTLLTVAGIAGLVFNDAAEIGPVHVNDLIWGGVLGLLVGVPLLLIGAATLETVSERIFIGMPDGAVFQSVVFVMSMAESLFFRGVVQAEHSMLITALMAGVWSMLLFLPTMDVGGYPMVTLIAGTFIAMLSVFYGYVRQRSGVAAAWLCQIIVSVLWLFVPRLLAG